MDFSKKKLSIDKVNELHRVDIETVQPFSLMLTPVYVYLRRNEKLLSLKGPLDFFTQDELNRLRPCEHFYFSKFIESVVPFRKAGLNVREALNWKALSLNTTSDSVSEYTLSPIPYVLSDKIIQIIGPLWWDRGNGDPGIEPFLVSAFVNEVCETLPTDKLLRARDLSVQEYERGILLSSWTIFLALHLGYCDLVFLNQLRSDVFDATVFGKKIERKDLEIKDLILFSKDTYERASLHAIESRDFLARSEKIAHKLVSRLNRISKEFVSRGETVPSIFGERGFIDA